MVLTSHSFGSGLGEAMVKVAAAKSMKKLVNCIFGSFEKKRAKVNGVVMKTANACVMSEEVISFILLASNSCYGRHNPPVSYITSVYCSLFRIPACVLY
jgi:hypothetical protein